MKRKITKLLFAILFVALSMFIVACGDKDTKGNGNDNGNNGANEQPNNENNGNDNGENNVGEEEPKEDITVVWAHQWGEEHFDQTIRSKVQDQFPHITFEWVDAGTDHPETLQDLVAAKQSPDVVSMGLVTHVNFLENLGLASRLDELIEKSGFDLNRLEPSIVSYARNQDPHNENGLYAIPNARPTWSLHYDRNIFDILGVEYPEDGMTWEEVYELAVKLTREVGGVQYRGLDLDVWYDSYTQFSQNSIDPETHEVLITESEAYRRFLEYAKRVVDIPGNYDTDKPSDMLHHWGGLLGEGNIAMWAASTNWGHLEDHDNIDIATYPVWEGYEGLNPVPNGGAWAITEPSEHKEELIKVIEYLLSDEVQMAASREGGKGGAEGGTSILVNPDVHAVFGEDNPNLQERNVDSLFKNSYATGPEQRARYGDGVLWTAANRYVDSGQDINEFLRVLQEEAEENVRQQIAQSTEADDDDEE